MQVIADWLLNGTYEAGVMLYKKYGTSDFLKKKLAVHRDEVRLRDELQQLAPKTLLPVPDKKTLQKPLTTPPPIATNHAEAKEHLFLLKKRDNIYRELNSLMAERPFTPAGAELLRVARTILLRNQALMEIWAKLDYYAENGTFVAEPIIERQQFAPTKESVQLLRQTISKAKARIASGKCRNLEQTQLLLKASGEKLSVMLAELKKA